MLLIWRCWHPPNFVDSDRGAKRPSHAPLFPPARGSWHHMAHSHIYYSSTSLPLNRFIPSHCSMMLLLYGHHVAQRGVTQMKREKHHHNLISCIFSILKHSCGLKLSAAGKWICVKLPRGHWPHRS